MQIEDDKDGFYKCGTCANSFLRFESDINCPYCQTMLPEVSLDREFIPELTKTLAEKNQEKIMEAMSQEDETIERIPDPEKNEIPIGGKRSTSVNILNRFKRVLRRRGN
jgi:uncharacterized Zn finger protein (UPF0148 family)